MSGFKDHFSGHAHLYGKYRPVYPESLYRFLAEISPGNDLAWDCATGNGQAAMGLAGHFRQVIATDASEQQIQQCVAHERIRYTTASAENSGIESSTVDIVTVAQALHWFDLERFYTETQRVLKPGGVLAAWTYSLFHITPEIDLVIHYLYEDILSEYWPPERRMVEQAYRNLSFPFEEIATPGFCMETAWDLDLVLGYLHTWSAVQYYIRKNHADPVDMILDALQDQWGDKSIIRDINWPLSLRAGKHRENQESFDAHA